MLANTLIKDGKGKAVYYTPDEQVLIKYKDTITGHEDGVPDPGGNRVIGAIPDSSCKYLSVTLALYQLLSEAGVPVVAAERVAPDRVMVETLRLLPVEVICRNRATGSFVRRYGKFVREGQTLNGLVEFTLKDDALGDPLIVEAALVRLGLLTPVEIQLMHRHTERTNRILQSFFATSGIELWDFKLEFGRRRDGTLVLRDELSTRTARFYRNRKLLDIHELYESLDERCVVS